MSTARVRSDHGLKAERDRFVAFSFASADLMVEVDLTNRIHFAHGALNALTGRNQIKGLSLLELVMDGDRGLVRTSLKGLGEGCRLDPVTVRFATESGAVYPLMMSACRLKERKDRIYITLALRPIGALPSSVFSELPERDETTGLLTKSSFEARARSLLANAPEDDPLKLTLIGLNGVEDLRGRLDGAADSAMMTDVSAALRSRSAGGDSAAHLGDGRFGLVHKSLMDSGDLMQEMEEITRSADPLGDGLSVALSSVDLATGILSEEDAARALSYSIGRFVEDPKFTIDSIADGLSQMLSTTVARIRRLRERIGTEKVAINYQPIVHLGTKRLHHYEALSKLDIGPSTHDTIIFAEQTGLVEDFDLAMCQSVLDLMDEIRTSLGPNSRRRAPKIAVNLSARSLQSDIFAGSLMRILEATISPEQLIMFEVTETAQVVDLERLSNVLRDLKERRVELCLDDFGAGTATFTTLRNLDIDYVKIDGSYVQDLVNNPRDKVFVRTIAAMCKDLEIATVAEWVEDEEQAKLLTDMGVEFAQGYLFGRPTAQIETPVGR